MYNNCMKWQTGLMVMLIPSFLVGYLAGRLSEPDADEVDHPPAVYSSTTFHDIRVNKIEEYMGLIEPESTDIKQLARQFKTIEEAYLFVSREVEFLPYAPPGPVAQTLRMRKGSCLGKAVLLTSIYRAMGLPHDKVRIFVGKVNTPYGVADHAWVSMEYDKKCFQQDPSGFIGNFGFYAFPGRSYAEAFVEDEKFCFNDKGFAVVSQLNRVPGSMPPTDSAR